jgi:hypothetical protein
MKVGDKGVTGWNYKRFDREIPFSFSISTHSHVQNILFLVNVDGRFLEAQDEAQDEARGT